MWTPRGNGHIAGTATWLTGGSYDREKLDAGGTSIDQIAAKHLRSQTLLPSLELSVRGEGIFTSSLPRNSISWVDSVTPAPRDIEPQAIFDRMFRAGESGLGSRAVIDLALADARRLKRRVSHLDQKKIDEYLDSVRAIERRKGSGESDSRPSKSSRPTRARHPGRSRSLHADDDGHDRARLLGRCDSRLHIHDGSRPEQSILQLRRRREGHLARAVALEGHQRQDRRRRRQNVLVIARRKTRHVQPRDRLAHRAGRLPTRSPTCSVACGTSKNPAAACWTTA